MDRYQFLAMGKRRPWIIGAQAGLMLALAVLGLFPVVGGELLVLMAIGFLANTFTAAQTSRSTASRSTCCLSGSAAVPTVS